MRSRGKSVLIACALYAQAHAQFQPGIVLGGGYFTPEARDGYAHEEQFCPEFGLLLGLKAGRSRLGVAVIHSTRSTTDRAEDPSTSLVQEDQQTRSVTAGLYALFPLTEEKKRMHYLIGPALDLVFPYRTDVQRTFIDDPPLDETDAFANYTPPGLRAGLRFRAEWRVDVQWTPFVQLGTNYTLRQTFTETSDYASSSVTPPTDRLDYHFWLGLSIALGGEDCDCPAFH